MQVRITEFTTRPGGRYRSQGPHSGEEFREEHLKPALDRAEHGGWHVDVDMRGTEFGAPVGFLEEAFGGLVRERGHEAVTGRLRITGDEYVDRTEIERLMAEAEWNAGTRTRYSDLLYKDPQPAAAISDALVYAAEAGDAIQWIQHHDFPRHTDAGGALYLASLDDDEGKRSARIRIRSDETVRIDERTLRVIHGAVVAHCIKHSRGRLRWEPTAAGGVRLTEAEIVTRLRSADGRHFELVNRGDTTLTLWSVSEATGTMEETPVNDRTKDALWTIATAARLVPGHAGEPATGDWHGPVRTQSTNGQVARRVRHRLQKWADRMAAWHAAWLVLSYQTQDQVELPGAYELASRGLDYSNDEGTQRATHEVEGEARSIWTSPAEVREAALKRVLGTSVRGFWWQPMRNDRIEPDQMSVMLADRDVNAGQLCIEAGLKDGAPQHPQLVDTSNPQETVEWESPEDNWKGDAEQRALAWLAELAAEAAGSAKRTSARAS